MPVVRLFTDTALLLRPIVRVAALCVRLQKLHEPFGVVLRLLIAGEVGPILLNLRVDCLHKCLIISLWRLTALNIFEQAELRVAAVPLRPNELGSASRILLSDLDVLEQLRCIIDRLHCLRVIITALGLVVASDVKCAERLHPAKISVGVEHNRQARPTQLLLLAVHVKGRLLLVAEEVKGVANGQVVHVQVLSPLIVDADLVLDDTHIRHLRVFNRKHGGQEYRVKHIAIIVDEVHRKCD